MLVAKEGLLARPGGDHHFEMNGKSVGEGGARDMPCQTDKELPETVMAFQVEGLLLGLASRVAPTAG